MCSAYTLEEQEMGKRQLLFVTHRDDDLEEGFLYAIELAKAMEEDIILLFVQKRSNLNSKLESMMTSITFAEYGEHTIAKQITSEDPHCIKKVYYKELDAIAEKCLHEGICLNVYTSTLDFIYGIRIFLKEHRAIDKVVLSPAITMAGNVSSKNMIRRLVRTTSRPIVTMTRRASAVLN
jgi:hypothetical protein